MSDEKNKQGEAASKLGELLSMQEASLASIKFLGAGKEETEHFSFLLSKAKNALKESRIAEAEQYIEQFKFDVESFLQKSAENEIKNAKKALEELRLFQTDGTLIDKAMQLKIIESKKKIDITHIENMTSEAINFQLDGKYRKAIESARKSLKEVKKIQKELITAAAKAVSEKLSPVLDTGYNIDSIQKKLVELEQEWESAGFLDSFKELLSLGTEMEPLCVKVKDFKPALDAAKKMVEEIKAFGDPIKKYMDLIAEAEMNFNKGKFEEAKGILNTAQNLASKRLKELSNANTLVNTIKDKISTGKSAGLDMASEEEKLIEVEKLLKLRNTEGVIKQARELYENVSERVEKIEHSSVLLKEATHLISEAEKLGLNVMIARDELEIGSKQFKMKEYEEAAGHLQHAVDILNESLMNSLNSIIEKAKAEIEKLNEAGVTSTEAHEHYKKAYEFFSQKQFGAGVIEAKNAIKLSEYHVAAHLKIREKLYQHQRMLKLINQAQRQLTPEIEATTDLISEVEKHLREADYKVAIEKAERARITTEIEVKKMASQALIDAFELVKKGVDEQFDMTEQKMMLKNAKRLFDSGQYADALTTATDLIGRARQKVEEEPKRAIEEVEALIQESQEEVNRHLASGNYSEEDEVIKKALSLISTAKSTIMKSKSLYAAGKYREAIITAYRAREELAGSKRSEAKVILEKVIAIIKEARSKKIKLINAEKMFQEAKALYAAQDFEKCIQLGREILLKIKEDYDVYYEALKLIEVTQALLDSKKMHPNFREFKDGFRLAASLMGRQIYPSVIKILTELTEAMKENKPYIPPEVDADGNLIIKAVPEADSKRIQQGLVEGSTMNSTETLSASVSVRENKEIKNEDGRITFPEERSGGIQPEPENIRPSEEMSNEPVKESTNEERTVIKLQPKAKIGRDYSAAEFEKRPHMFDSNYGNRQIDPLENDFLNKLQQFTDQLSHLEMQPNYMHLVWSGRQKIQEAQQLWAEGKRQEAISLIEETITATSQAVLNQNVFRRNY